jgi:hypothetical protein
VHRLRSQSGQSSTEYMGALLVVAIIVFALVPLAGGVAGHAERLLGCIAGGGACGDEEGTAQSDSPNSFGFTVADRSGTAAGQAPDPASGPASGFVAAQPGVRPGRVICPFVGPGCWVVPAPAPWPRGRVVCPFAGPGCFEIPPQATTATPPRRGSPAPLSTPVPASSSTA